MNAALKQDDSAGSTGDRSAFERADREGRGPRRTCAGCREEDHKHALLRFAVRDESPRLVPDVRSRLPGRGVSVHPRAACLEKAVKRGGFARALRSPVAIDLRELAHRAAEQYLRRVDGLIGSAVRSQRAAIGTDAVRDAMTSGRLATLVVAGDAAGRREELMAAAARLGRRCVVLGDKAWLGRLAGRGDVAVLGLLDAGIADEVTEMVERAKELGMPGVEVISAANEAGFEATAMAGRKV